MSQALCRDNWQRNGWIYFAFCRKGMAYTIEQPRLPSPQRESSPGTPQGYPTEVATYQIQHLGADGLLEMYNSRAESQPCLLKLTQPLEPLLSQKPLLSPLKPVLAQKPFLAHELVEAFLETMLWKRWNPQEKSLKIWEVTLLQDN